MKVEKKIGTQKDVNDRGLIDFYIRIYIKVYIFNKSDMIMMRKWR